MRPAPWRMTLPTNVKAMTMVLNQVIGVLAVICRSHMGAPQSCQGVCPHVDGSMCMFPPAPWTAKVTSEAVRWSSGKVHAWPLINGTGSFTGSRTIQTADGTLHRIA